MTGGGFNRIHPCIPILACAQISSMIEIEVEMDAEVPTAEAAGAAVSAESHWGLAFRRLNGSLCLVPSGRQAVGLK